MKHCLLFSLVFLTNLALGQDIGKECSSTIKCLNSTEFTFCSIIDGQVILGPESFTCPDGHICVGDPFVPCVEVSTTPITTESSVTVTPECILGVNYSAIRCFQYYECVKFFWWFSLQLKTCNLGTAFDPMERKCVSIYYTECSI